MRRILTAPRTNWQQTVESQGLTFHSRTAPYWNERAYYEFTSKQIDTLEAAANTVHELCLAAAQRIIDKGEYERLALTPRHAELIEQSWNADQLHLYGRFDFAWNGVGEPKLIEYNADTPTSILEASAVQWYWLQDKFPNADQFNSLHERLVERWKELGLAQPVTFTTLSEIDGEAIEEDVLTVEYLRDTATQAGLQTQFVDIGDIGFNAKDGTFRDQQDRPIPSAFKLYPWEDLANDAYGAHIKAAPTRWIEPAWKMLWSNKALLPILWELAPNHPNLLASYDSPEKLSGAYVSKPLFGREGQNVAIHDGSLEVADGHYGDDRVVYQQYYDLPVFDGKRPMLGVWMIGDYARGLGIRESAERITGNTSQFVPHLFKP